MASKNQCYSKRWLSSGCHQKLTFQENTCFNQSRSMILQGWLVARLPDISSFSLRVDRWWQTHVSGIAWTFRMRHGMNTNQTPILGRIKGEIRLAFNKEVQPGWSWMLTTQRPPFLSIQDGTQCYYDLEDSPPFASGPGDPDGPLYVLHLPLLHH